MSACGAFGFVPAQPSLGTALISVWLHDPDHIAHIPGNLVAVLIFGAVVEPKLGHGRLLGLLISAGIGGVLMHLLVEPNSHVPLVGMSASLCGLMAAGAAVRPPMMLGFTATFIVFNFVGLYVTTPFISPGVSVAAHVGGFSVGSLLMVIGRIRGVRWAVA